MSRRTAEPDKLFYAMIATIKKLLCAANEAFSVLAGTALIVS